MFATVEWPNDIVLDTAINHYLALLRKEDTFLFNKKSTGKCFYFTELIKLVLTQSFISHSFQTMMVPPLLLLKSSWKIFYWNMQ